MPVCRVLVIVPCLNEADSLPAVLSDLKNATRALAGQFQIDVVVVDDGSEDGSSQIAVDHGVVVLRHCANLGIGGAVQSGLRFALRNGYDFATQVDGDGQHPPEQLKSLLLAAQLSPGNDLVIGSRFVEHNGYQSTIPRRIGSLWLAVMLRVLTGLKVADPTSGFRVFGIRALRLFAQHYPYDYPEPESLAIAKAARLKIAEVSVKMKQRQGGSSSLRGLKGPYYMVKVSVAILLAVFRRVPLTGNVEE